jgi:hypothetical protein
MLLLPGDVRPAAVLLAPAQVYRRDLSIRSDRGLGQGGPEPLNPRATGLMAAERSKVGSRWRCPQASARRPEPGRLPCRARRGQPSGQPRWPSCRSWQTSWADARRCASAFHAVTATATGHWVAVRSCRRDSGRHSSLPRTCPASRGGCQRARRVTWRLPERLPRVCRATWPLATRPAAGLPASGRAPAGVGHHRTRKPTRVANQITKTLRKSLGWASVLASVSASAPEQAAHQHPRVREAAQS